MPGVTTRSEVALPLWGAAAFANTRVLERRHERRVALEVPAALQADAPAREATLCDISTSGAFIAMRGASLAPGTGLRLEFTLPQGFRVNAFGRVAWVRDDDEQGGPAGCGVRFYGLDDVNREFIQYYLDLDRSKQQELVLGGKVETRFEVNDAEGDQLYVRVSGSLTQVEADGLEEVVCRKLARLSRDHLYVYIDARELGACAKAALDHLRNWLERLRVCRELLGVLVGDTGVGVVQLRRLVREAGIADHFVMFVDDGEARVFWRELMREASARPRPRRLW